MYRGLRLLLHHLRALRHSLRVLMPPAAAGLRDRRHLMRLHELRVEWAAGLGEDRRTIGESVVVT